MGKFSHVVNLEWILELFLMLTRFTLAKYANVGIQVPSYLICYADISYKIITKYGHIHSILRNNQMRRWLQKKAKQIHNEWKYMNYREEEEEAKEKKIEEKSNKFDKKFHEFKNK